MSYDEDTFYDLVDKTKVHVELPIYSTAKLMSMEPRQINAIVQEAKQASFEICDGVARLAREVTSERNELAGKLNALQKSVSRKVVEAKADVPVNLSYALQSWASDRKYSQANDPKVRVTWFQFDNDLHNALKLLVPLFAKYGIAYDVESVINVPGEIDSLIKRDPRYLALKAVPYLVADIVHAQHIDPSVILKAIIDNPWLKREDVNRYMSIAESLLSGSFKVDYLYRQVDAVLNGLNIKVTGEKSDIMNSLLLDKSSMGFHLNYMLLPNADFATRFIFEHNRDVHGLVYSDSDINSYEKNHKYKSAIEHEYGQRKLIGLSDQVIGNQIELGMVKNYSEKIYA
jgi:hypothetical protein